jgi:hypothetical protein
LKPPIHILIREEAVPGRTIDMTVKEAQILLGVRLMYWGVPFQVAHRRRLGEADEEIGDNVWERLLALRDAARDDPHCRGQGGQPSVSLPLTRAEAGLWVEMTKACLGECGTDEVDLDVHLGTRARDEVERLLARLAAFEEEE